MPARMFAVNAEEAAGSTAAKIQNFWIRILKQLNHVEEFKDQKQFGAAATFSIYKVSFNTS